MLRVKHLYRLIGDVSFKYQINITHVSTSEHGYIVVANELNQLEVLYVSFSEKIEIKTIVAVKKPACREIKMNGRLLVTAITDNRFDVAIFDEASCAFKTKYETKQQFTKFAISRNSVYLLDAEGDVRRISRVGEKFIETARYTPPDKPILDLNVLEIQ